MSRHPTEARLAGLLVGDLDGTLLDDAGRVPPGVRTALEDLAALRVPLVVCTGRPLAAAARLIGGAGLTPLLIACFHGALVVRADLREVVRHLTLSPGALETVAAVLRSLGPRRQRLRRPQR